MTFLAKTVGRTGATALLTLAVSLGAMPLAAENSTHSVLSADEIMFTEGPPFLPAGVELAVLAGNPGDEGVFVIRLRFPEGYAIPPHTHTMDELVTVISGELGIAMGDTLDRTAAPLLSAGSFAILPANMAHYAWADAETVVQIAGMGPFEINYLVDADDPRIN